MKTCFVIRQWNGQFDGSPIAVATDEAMAQKLLMEYKDYLGNKGYSFTYEEVSLIENNINNK